MTYPTLLASSFPTLVPLMLAFEIPQAALESWILALPATSSEAFFGKIFVALINGVWVFFEFLFVIFFCRAIQSTDKSQSLMAFIARYSYQYFLESIRVFSNLIPWYLLLIVPGIYKQISWSFVPFVVVLDKKYDAGDVDALYRSTDLVKGNFLGLSMVLGLQLTLAFTFDLFKPATETFFSTLTLNALLGVIGLFVSVFVYSFLFLFFANQSAIVPYKEEA